MNSLARPITLFCCLLILFNLAQAQVFNTDTSAFMLGSIEGSASWTKDAVSGDFIYDNAGTISSQRAILYSTDAYQSKDGFKLTIEYTTGSTGDDEAHNFSFGLISNETDLSSYDGFNPFRAEQSVYSVGVNLTTDEDPTARGLNFTNGTERVTFDEAGTRAEFLAEESTRVTIEIGIGGYWSYRINDVFEADGVLLEGFDLSRSYHVVIYGQDDNGGGKSIQSIKLEKRYAAGERAKKVRGTWHSGIDPTLIDERISSLKTLDYLGVSFTNGASLSAEHKAPHKLLESIEGSEEVVPPWGHLNFKYPENDPLMDNILIIKEAGFKVQAYVNSENFVGVNQDQFLVFVENWMEYCDTNAEVQAFINSQPYHTGIWNRTTQQYVDATASYPLRKYMFCYAEFVLKDYALRYGEYIDSWIFDDGSTMVQNGDNATSGLIQEQRIYQAYANAVHAGNPEIPVAFNNGRSTVNYSSYPFAHAIRFEDFTFGHAFGGNNNHAEKIDGNQFNLNYQHITRMTETDGFVHDGGSWSWDDLIVGNFHSKLSTTAWKYGPTQAWEQDDFNQWNLEAMQAGGSMTWAGSYNRSVTAVYDWVYVLLEGLDDHLAQYESPGAPNWARAYTILPSASIGEQYSYALIEGVDFWDPEGDEITELLVVSEDDSPAWLSISETTEGTWTLSGTPDETAAIPYDFRLRVKDATEESDRMVHLNVVDPNAIVSLTGLNISTISSAMYLGSTFQLATEAIPIDATNQTVTWSSSDTLLAKVSSTGLVTAIDTGNVIITATSIDGGFSDSCEMNITIEVKEPCELANIALCGEASQSSTDYGGVASRAIDGNTDGNYANNSVTHTLAEANPWWELDLGLEYSIGNINIFNRAGKNNIRLSNFTVIVYNADSTEVFSQTYDTHPDPSVTCNAGGVIGQRVKIQLNATNPLSLAEVQIYEFFPVDGILISDDSISIIEGNTVLVSASVIPSNATSQGVTWSSADVTIASVDASGLITAIDTGEVTITATTVEGAFTDECVVSVFPFVPVSGVVISQDSMSFSKKGVTLSLNATVYPLNASNKNTSWNSSSTSVATVSSSGVVTAVGDGVTTITVSTIEGSYTDSCIVTVDIITPVNGVSVTPDSVSLTSIGASKSLSVTVYPPNATYKGVSWTSNNTSIASVDTSGLVMAHDSGLAIITATTVDSEYTDNCVVSVTIEDTTGIGIFVNAKSAKFVILYPNPANSTLHFDFRNIEGVSRIAIYSILGKQMDIQLIDSSTGNIDLSKYQSGVYILKIMGDETVVTWFVKE